MSVVQWTLRTQSHNPSVHLADYDPTSGSSDLDAVLLYTQFSITTEMTDIVT